MKHTDLLDSDTVVERAIADSFGFLTSVTAIRAENEREERVKAPHLSNWVVVFGRVVSRRATPPLDIHQCTQKPPEKALEARTYWSISGR